MRFGLRALGGGGLLDEGTFPGSLVGWGLWVWAAVVWASPWRRLAAATGLRRIEPVWEDAARLAGLSRRAAWQRLVWPHVRPPLARLLGLVFGLTLLDPGPGLILGLRRTLGYQIVHSAQDSGSPGQLTRAVVLAGFGTLLAFAGRFLLNAWGGREPDRSAGETAPIPAPARASWRRATACLAVPLGLAVLTWLPLLTLARASLEGQGGWSASAYAGVFQDLLTRQALVGSAVLCVSVACLDLVAARALGRLTRSRPRLSRLTSALLGVPPLAIGVGALAIPGLLSMAAEGAEGLAGPSSFAATAAEAMRALGDLLDPDRTPWVVLVLGVSAARLRALWKTAEDRLRREHAAPREAAELLGLSQRTARRLARGGLPLPSPASVLTGVLAATSLAPALVLAPTAETRPVGPALVDLADRPGDAPARASALALGVVLLNAAGHAAASRAKGGPKRLDPGG
ncbi:MAG: hypothetical protein U0835_11465 [Isosphaeraceae bacterium]